jgi:hypothetical protein
MTFNKKLIHILLLFFFLNALLVLSPAKADDTTSATSSFISDAIAAGFNKILENTADQLYSVAGTDRANASILLDAEMHQKNDFLSNPGVQKMKDFTAFWFFLFYIIFLLVGGIGVMREAADGPFGGGGTWRNQYFEIAVFAPLIWAFYLYGLQWIFSLEWVLTSSAFLESVDLIGTVPITPIDYFMWSAINVALLIALYMRYLLVGLIAAFFLLIVAAALFPPTRRFAGMILSWGALMLFSRFIMALIIVGGTSIMSGLPRELSSNLGIYLIIVAVAFIFTTACILWPIISAFINPLKYMVVRRALYGDERRY